MLATILTLGAAVYLCAWLVIPGARKPGYSHLRHTISELGEVGAPHARLVAFGVFLPVGIVLLAVAGLARPADSAASVLALCIAIGYIVAAIFPCDVGSPASGSWRQFAHNMGGTVEYIGGGLVMLSLAGPFNIVGMIVLGAGILISVPPLAAIRGLIQRLAELCLFGSLAGALYRVA